MERKSITESLPQQAQEIRLIKPGPRLRYIHKTLELLRPERNELGEEQNWKELHKEVPPWENGLQLTDNVREVVRSYIAKKIPKLKEAIPSIEGLSDKQLLNALAHNWFEELDDKIEDQRRKVLLAVAASVVKRTETFIYMNLFKNMGQEELSKLGLNDNLRNLLIEILRISQKANPLFLRFLAYTQLSEEPPKRATPTALFLPNDRSGHTIAELFPHETQYLANGFRDLSTNENALTQERGGDGFKKYLQALSRFYSEKDPKEAQKIQKQEVEKLYNQCVASGFPIILTPTLEGFYQEPYLDPELKVSIATPDSAKEEGAFTTTQKALAESLDVLNQTQFEEPIKRKVIRSTMSVGAYGVNLVFNSVAQEDPAILVFLNEQIRAYDRDFPVFTGLVANTEKEFASLSPENRRELMEKMSRTNTVMHELVHGIYPDSSKEAQRLGKKPLTIIDEVKAEISFRPLVPSLVEKGALPGTTEQWAIGMLTSALQMLKDQPPGDEYFYAAIYTLNDLFDKGIIEFENGKVNILDFNKYYQSLKESSLEIISLYESRDVNEAKAAGWIKKRCRPNDKVSQLIEFLKSIV